MPMATKPVHHNYWAHILQLDKAPAQQGRPNTAKNKYLKKKKKSLYPKSHLSQI